MATLLRALLWLTVGGWIGAWALFAFAVAPLAFRVLPTPEVAGTLVAPLLRDLHLLGAAAGAVASGLAVALRRQRLLVLLPLALAGVCLASHFGVSGAIEEIRPYAFGADAQAQAASQFAQLHLLSRTLYAATGLGAIGLIVLHARADAETPREPGKASAGPPGRARIP